MKPSQKRKLRTEATHLLKEIDKATAFLKKTQGPILREHLGRQIDRAKDRLKIINFELDGHI